MVTYVKAVHTFVAEHGDELEFQAGESIEVLERDEAFGDGWWRGKNERGEEGLFPATYITEGDVAKGEGEKVDEAPSKPGASSAPEPAVDTERIPSPPTDFSAPAPPIATNTLALTESHRSASPQATSPAVQPAQALSIPTPPSPKNIESNPETVDQPRGLLDTAVEAAGAAAVTAGGVMSQTLGEIQHAIEQIGKPDSDNEQDDREELGINSDARARLAEQAKKANEQRDKHISGGVAGLVYSDESDDEEEEVRSRGRNSFGVMSNGNGVGSGFGNGIGGGHAARGLSLDSPTEPLDTSRGFAAEARRASNRSISGVGVRTPKETMTGSDGALGPALNLPITPPVGGKALTGASASGKDVTTWSIDEVVAWAESKGFEETICDKFREHEITGDLLVELDANLLKELDIPQFGKRLRIAQAIAELRRPASTPSSHEMSTRGMSAPPSALISMPPTSSTPPLTTPPTSAPLENAPYSAWATTSSRRTSANTPVTAPSMEAIREDRPHTQSSTPAQSASISSVPNSPVTPSSAVTKRESTGSMGHKRGKPSVDKDRLSFFGRNRKPAPTATSPGDNKPRISGPGKVHQMQPATPEQARKVSSVSAPGTAAALRQIGTPDHSGFMKKKGERIGWKTRYFVLKGAHLYFLKSEHEDKVKGHIDLRGYRVIVDENTNPGSYGFRLVGSGPPHAFSSAEQGAIREWMKALMKATIARDYNVPVTSSCNIPTIPLAEAQAMSPRPPSPATREATQRLTRRENTNTLTAHDANILMSLDTSKRASQQLTPSRPSRDERRPSNAQISPAPRPTTVMSNKSSINDDPHSRELVAWVNAHLPPQYPKASSIPASFASGEVIFLLVRALSGIEPSPPVSPNAFAPEGGMPGLSGLFSMMDILIDAGVDTAGVSINDVRSGDKGQISRLVESIRAWQEARVGGAR